MRQEYRNEILRTPNLTNLYQIESFGEKSGLDRKQKISSLRDFQNSKMSNALMTLIISNYYLVSFYICADLIVLEKIHLGCMP